jgi:hypothetical protein
MDEVSVTRPSPPSTKAIVANEDFCKQVAALLLCDLAPIHDAFIGEPAQEVLEMVQDARSLLCQAQGRDGCRPARRGPDGRGQGDYETSTRLTVVAS